MQKAEWGVKNRKFVESFDIYSKKFQGTNFCPVTRKVHDKNIVHITKEGWLFCHGKL
jgi:hypothetical protein